LIKKGEVSNPKTGKTLQVKREKDEVSNPKTGKHF